MHGCKSGFALLVNAEVDSMGGFVDGAVGIGVKTSPRIAAIEKAQAELRQEYDVRDERRRELEFLEKGGNPLDFKFGNANSVSVQSTSLTDQQVEHIVTSEAKASFVLTASPRGDSVESSGRPGIPLVCEPNSADNLLLFDGESELPEGERKSIHPCKKNFIVPSEQSSQMDGTQNAKESEDSAIFRPYARRNRSKMNREGARSSSIDIAQGRSGHGSFLPVHGAPTDAKSLASETNNQKDKNIASVNNAKSATSNGDFASNVITSNNQLTMELDGGQAVEEITDQSKADLSKSKVDATALKSLTYDLPNEPAQVEAQKSLVNQASREPDLVVVKQQVVPTGLEHATGAFPTKAENESDSNQLNGFGDAKRDRRNISNEKNNSATIGMKGLDSESSCTQNSLSLDVNNDNDVLINPKTVESDRKPMEKTSEIVDSLNLGVGELVTENSEMKAVDNIVIGHDTNTSVNQNHSTNGSIVKMEEEIRSELQNEVTCPFNNEVELRNHAVSEADMRVSTMLVDDSDPKKENISASRPQDTKDNFICEFPDMTLTGRNPTTNPQINSDDHVKVVDKAQEDSILEEARIIEAKRKRIAELSGCILPLENCQKSHWDFVLEEMAWLANDFAQERLWKLTAAAQICHRVAFTSRLKLEEQNQYWKLKRVALTLANAVMEFWHSAEDRNKEQKSPRKNDQCAILAYAHRFLKYSSSPVPILQAEAPATPDRISDLGIMDVSWDEHLTEESLFYAVPSGAMETYRRSIESHLLQSEKTGSSVQEEGETSLYDTRAEFGCNDFVYDEDEGETSTYYLPGAFEGSRPSNLKRWKNPMKSYPSRPYDMGADQPYTNCTQQSMPMGKRPVNNLNVGPIPTKRVRTGSRQRVLSPFGCSTAAGCLQLPIKADASSGDTSSFQDDQSTLHGGFQFQRNMEAESVGDFERQLLYESAETPTKPKKKKKAKILSSTYDQGWQLESTVHSEQRDYSKRRLESHHFDSNGANGLYGLHNAKKPKIMNQQLDNSFDITPTGSIPSPVGSQMSNMSNPNKFIKMIQSRDRGTKPKTPKMSANQPGLGCPWSQFEDQALVVLVHDLGPNWELISDAINSTLQFKCIFRKPKECKERHKTLMNKSGDGADSADDSGSSQSYPSTLPGIPKGSARQLFQRLQGPMEEDTLKSHFEQIVLTGKKQLYRRSQNDNQELKQIVPVHNSHVLALSQVCPNNLNGGVLTPLDLCDATPSSQDVLALGYQASHAGSVAISNQAAVGSMPSTSGASLRESSSMVLSNNCSPSSAPVNASIRDGRYGVPRTSMPADEQHRMQQYNQMLSGRNIQQSNLSVPGAISGSDRGVRMLPGGNGMGMMCGVNRSMPISRPGFQGMASSTMLNSGSMLSSNMVGMPSPVNMHSGPGSGQGNSMLRPHDTMHMMRPGHNPEHQRQLMAPDLQLQAQANGQGVSPFNGLSSAYPNQSNAPPVQSYPGHLQQQQHPMSPQQSHPLSNSHHAHLQGSNHANGSQQQAYAMRFAKQQQQRIMQQHQQQPQQQFSASSTLMSHVQPQTQLPISSLQNSSQIQSQASTQPVSLSPLTPSSPMTPMALQHQQKHQLASQGLGRNCQPGASGLTNQIGKQRQRPQQFQQSGRHHPQQRHQTQSQQQAKLLKGLGRGNMLVQQNLSVDPGHLNGLNIAPGSQAAEKGEQMAHLVQGQGLYSGTSMSPVQPSKPLVSPQSSNLTQPQQKLFSGATSPSTKQLQQVASHPNKSTPGQVTSAPSGHSVSAVHQSVLPAAMGPNHQPLQLQTPHQKHVNQNQPTGQRMLEQNRQVNSDPPCKSQVEPGQPDQQPMNNASPVGTTTTMAMPQAGTDSASNPVPAVSQWKELEPVYDPSMTNVTTQLGSLGSSSLTNSAVCDPVPSVNQGLGQRQLSGGLPPGNNAGVQWPKQPQMQHSSTKSPSQQHYQPQEPLQQDQHNSPQKLPLQQSHQQTPHLQAVQGNVYHRPSNSKLD